MNIRITDDGNAVTVNNVWSREESRLVLKNLPKTQVDAYEAAIAFMSEHPEFHSVVFSTDCPEVMEEAGDD